MAKETAKAVTVRKETLELTLICNDVSDIITLSFDKLCSLYEGMGTLHPKLTFAMLDHIGFTWDPTRMYWYTDNDEFSQSKLYALSSASGCSVEVKKIDVHDQVKKVLRQLRDVINCVELRNHLQPCKVQTAQIHGIVQAVFALPGVPIAVDESRQRFGSSYTQVHSWDVYADDRTYAKVALLRDLIGLPDLIAQGLPGGFLRLTILAALPPTNAQ